jgi:FAD/FMN-containing dehydrogenase
MSITNFSGTVLHRNDTGFEAARFGWNAMIDRKPSLIACCACTDDVVEAVRYAAENDLLAVARCGGHSVSGASLPEGGILIDLSGMKNIEVDPAGQTASIGGGVLLGELDTATQAHGLAVTAGIEPETGAGGLTLGGGIGFLARKLGLTIDNLIGAQVVLADGSIVETNTDSHPDLFWALRGGGGQFGIVTRFDYKLHSIGPQIVTAQAYYPLEKAKEVGAFVESFMRTAPDDITLVPVFMTIPSVEAIPAQWHGKYAAAMVACDVGPESTAKERLASLLDMDDLIFGFVDTMPYLEFQKTFGGASPHGARYYWKSIFVDQITDELIEVLVEGLKDLDGEYSQIFMETLGGAVGRVPVEDTAFANRSALYNLGISAGWNDSAMDDAIVGSAKRLFDRLKPFSDGTVYLNYLDRDEIDRAKVGLGPNFDRLLAVKKIYDPENRFGGPLGGAG